jgi:hypothetical protein
MVKLELDEHLRRISLSKINDLQLLLAEMSAFQIKYEISLAATKHTSVIFQAQQR